MHSVIMLSATYELLMLSAIILIVIMLNVIMLSVIMLNAAAPYCLGVILFLLASSPLLLGDVIFVQLACSMNDIIRCIRDD
jgi:hypothetical protein